MGQKVHPEGFRLGYIKTWKSRWFATRAYADQLHEDLKIRRHLKERLYHAGVSRIEFERKANQLRIIVRAARPGIIIGRKGSEVDKIRQELAAMTDKELQLDITEVRKAETNAQLVAEATAAQLERRVAFRRVMKRAVQSAIRLGAQGVKIMVSGRLGGAEIARTEWYREGRVPLHTLRADIDYGFAEARTSYGRIGVKAWIFHGEVIPEAVAEGERPTVPDVREERQRRRRKGVAEK
ncbi:MAG: 30S ribosomal protein S3 [Candidatus Methylomirabilales bacterium]